MSKKSAHKKNQPTSPAPESQEPVPQPEIAQEQPKDQAQPETQPQPEIPNAEELSSTPEPTSSPVPTLEQLHQEIFSLKQQVAEHATLIKQLQEILAKRRKPVASNGKVQIRDKQTGTIYPSKNNAYQSLLKSGGLKDLVDKEVFGDLPEKNTFGWYTLVREWPDRFEEIHEVKQS